MNTEEIKKFKNQMQILVQPQSPLMTSNQNKANQLRAQKQKIQNLKKVISDNMNDLLDFNRCADESSKLGGSVPNLKRDVGTCQMQLNNLKDTRERLAMEVETLRKLMDTGNALWQDATRLSAKKIDVEEKLKDEETSVGTGSFLDTRSLATVESELFDRLKKKDLLSDEISKLNKEMSDLNNEITSLTTKVRLTSSGV
jgi:chromosome segregation ATPase